MTIASEISRLQGAKADICTAIENKGVTVGNITLDNYPSCIDAISQGGGKNVDYIMMGGGGGGGGGSTAAAGGGGGGGGVKTGTFLVGGNSLSICIGTGGSGGTTSVAGANGGSSCILDNETGKAVSVLGGGGGGANCSMGCCGGSGGGASTRNWTCVIQGGSAIGDVGTMGTEGGSNFGCYCCNLSNIAGGGGGAKSSGRGNLVYCKQVSCCFHAPGGGGEGVEGCWGGKTVCYAGGGGGGFSCARGSDCNYGRGASGGGNGGGRNHVCGYDASTCGSGGGGGAINVNNNGGSGAGGLVIIGYNCVCKDCNGFTCATGGNCCYVCGDCKFHCFTSDGTFTVVS